MPNDDDNIPSNEFFESIQRLTRDLRNASITLSEREARFLVDAYYAMQRDRIRAAHQQRTLSANEEPHDVLGWLFNQRETMEKQIGRALDAYSAGKPAGQWARSITGIGPIISAGLIANIYMGKWCAVCHGHDEDDCKRLQADTKRKLVEHTFQPVISCPTVGHIWRFAGLDPTRQWIGTVDATKLVNQHIHKGSHIGIEDLAALAEEIHVTPTRLLQGADTITKKNLTAVIAKRPWNGSLKRLCFLIGESFVKVSNIESDYYGKIYQQRKIYESAKNEAGDYADQAAQALATKNFGAETDARKHYEAGHLPPARIHLRSCRYAVKHFLVDLHSVMYQLEFKEQPPKPWIISHGGHTHYVPPPNWPMKPTGR